MNLGGAIHLNKTGIIILIIVSCVLFIFTLSGRSSNDQKKVENLNLKHLLQVAIRAAENGGKEVVELKDNLKIESKGLTKEGAQDSVTTADFLSHCAIVATFKQHFPDLNVISEETVKDCGENTNLNVNENYINDLKNEFVDVDDLTIWIDPLDATQEYTEKLYEYVTTMVCIAVKGIPVIGIIHNPFLKTTSWAWVGNGKSADLIIPKSPPKQLSITISRSHKGQVEEVLQKIFKNDYKLVVAGGAGFKALSVAKQKVDAYVHITAIKKWDICAGNAIITALGGNMTTKYNKIIDYSDEKSFLNENGLIATLENHNLFVGKL